MRLLRDDDEVDVGTAPEVEQGALAPDVETPADLRTPMLGVVAWVAALAGLHLSALVNALGWLGLAAMAAGLAHRRGLRREHLAWLAVLVAVAGGTLLRLATVQSGPLPGLAAAQATAQVTLRLSGDPVRKQGRFSDYVLVRATLTRMTARGSAWTGLRQPVLVIAPKQWGSVRLGQTVTASGRLAPADGNDLAAVVSVRGSPHVDAADGPLLAAAGRVRAGLRASVAHQAQAPRALVPALVDGDDAGLPPAVAAEFRTSGLTHLLAVSGTNLTLVVGALLVLARALGVRARGLMLVGALGVAGFVLLARPEPSVLRAAAMGSVALVGMGSNGRERGTRALGLALLVLLLLDPWLAGEIGFALSALATAGILFLAPGWRDALTRWLPRWAAEALAVPLAAQLACTPLVAAISGQVSLVAVVANLLAAPAVAPATVLGLVGGVLSSIWVPLGRGPGTVAAWCASWIIGVAHRTSGLPSAAVGWPTNLGSLLVLTVICGWLALTLGALLARRGWAMSLSAVALVAMLVPLPTPGWPPSGWVLAACDVGQGDGLVLNAGSGAGVVVDTGPDPALMDGCLRRLGVRRVPLLVFTHFHADHVDGLSGVLHGRQVGAIEVTSLDDPQSGAREVQQLASARRVPVHVVRLGERVQLGPLRWQVLAPSGPPPVDSDSPPNDSSIVLLVQTRGIRLLLMGDEETGSQARLADRVRGLHVDVLKVSHHGSAKQDPGLVRDLHPRLAVISVGLHNDYGHPAPSTLRLMESAGALVRRTDLDGDVAVVVDGSGQLHVEHRLPAVRPP
ncbi:MAG: ComEC/Rec2 family competence protein [Marmoricola sp.]